MADMRLGKLVRSVTILEGPPSSRRQVAVFEETRRKKKKKGTRGLRELDRALRTWVDAQAAFSNGYANAHRKSNRKRKDGWLRDVNLNLARATRKGAKKYRWERWLLP